MRLIIELSANHPDFKDKTGKATVNKVAKELRVILAQLSRDFRYLEDVGHEGPFQLVDFDGVTNGRLLVVQEESN